MPKADLRSRSQCDVDLAERIGELWERRDDLDLTDETVRETVHEAIDLLDAGKARVAELDGDDVVVHQWCKQAILLLFRIAPMATVELGPFEYADKIPLKVQYERLGVRVVPGASARWGSYLAPGVIMMPSYVNIGAYVGENTMVDTWATVGSCAQIGRNVHLSGGVGIGGVLEPQNAAPVMIGDEVMIGSRSMITAGRDRRRGLGARRGRDPQPVDPGHRRRDRRGGEPRRRAALVGRGAGHPARRSSPAATSACRACWCCAGSPPASATTRRCSTRPCATTA